MWGLSGQQVQFLYPHRRICWYFDPNRPGFVSINYQKETLLVVRLYSINNRAVYEQNLQVFIPLPNRTGWDDQTLKGHPHDGCRCFL